MVNQFTKIKTNDGDIYLSDLEKKILSNLDIRALLKYITSNEKYQAEQDALINTKVSLADERLSDAREPLEHKHDLADIEGLNVYDKSQINQLVYELREDLLERFNLLPDAIKSELVGKIEALESKYKEIESKKPDIVDKSKTIYVEQKGKDNSAEIIELQKANKDILKAITELVTKQIDLEELQDKIVGKLTDVKQPDGEKRYRQVNIVGGGSNLAKKLKFLTDVDVEGVTDGQIIQYNSSTEKWEASDLPPAGVTELNNLTGDLDIVAGTNIDSVVASGTNITINAADQDTDPAGSNTQIQYNDSGAFGASSDFTWDDTAKAFTVGNGASSSMTTTLASDGGVTVATSGTDGDYNVDLTGATDGDFSVNGNQLFVDTSTGNVGINTTPSVNYALDVNGRFNMGPNNNLSIAANGRITIQNGSIPDLTIKGGQSIQFSSGGSIRNLSEIRSSSGTGTLVFTVGDVRMGSGSNGKLNIAPKNTSQSCLHLTQFSGGTDTVVKIFDDSGSQTMGVTTDGFTKTISSGVSEYTFDTLVSATSSDGDGISVGWRVENKSGVLRDAVKIQGVYDDISEDQLSMRFLVRDDSSIPVMIERMRVEGWSGNVGIGTTEPTQKLDIDSDSVRIRTSKTPASANDTGDQGQQAWDEDYLYQAIATDTWKRTPIYTWSGTNKVVKVFELSDFPAPVSGVITLEDGVKYELCATVNCGTNQITTVAGGENLIVSANPFTYKLITNVPNGTAFLIGDIGRFNIEEINIEAETTNQGTLFGFNSSTATTPFLFVNKCRFIGFNSLGTIEGTRGSMSDVLFSAATTGLTIDDTGTFPASWVLQGVAFAGISNTHLTFEGTNSLISLNQISAVPPSGVALFDFKSTGTYDAVFVNNCVFSDVLGGSFLAAGSEDQTSVEFRFTDNLNTRDSAIKGSCYFVGNSTETTISAANTPVAISGTTTAGELERFTHNSAGILTYIGKEPTTLRIEGRAKIEVNSNLEEVVIATYIYKNGSQEASTVAQVTIESVFQTPTSPEFVSVDNLQLDTNDTIQMFIENKTDTTNITVTELKLIV